MDISVRAVCMFSVCVEGRPVGGVLVAFVHASSNGAHSLYEVRVYIC
jgi:hypothetical protein